MYVVEVIPLKKGVLLESLTYYSTYPYDVGAIVTIPLRSKTTQAVVVKIEEVSSAKTTLRAATFTLRKLPPQEKTALIADGIMKTAVKLAAEYPYPLGTILFALLPTEIKNGKMPFPQIHAKHITNENAAPQTEVLMASYLERIEAYRSVIRSTFAHGGSTLVVVPTAANIDPLKAVLESGIKDRVTSISSGSQKQTQQWYEKYEDCSKAKVIITTPNHAFLDRHDITTIIVDQSRSQHYNQRTQPYLDFRRALEVYAHQSQKQLIFADTLIRSEEEAKVRSGLYSPLENHPKRLNLPAKLQYVERPKREGGQTYQLITPDVTEAIDKVLSSRRNIFVYAPRRGLAPLVLCSDCGHIFRCEDSGAPYTLERKMVNGEEERWFVAKASGKRVRAADVCPACGSWKLREQGIGIQKVYHELQDLFPDAPVILFDSETAKTKRQAKTLVRKFYESKGAIIVGTSMVFPFLAAPINTCVVTSLEAVRATPTWRSQEDLFGLLLFLRERATDTVFVQGKEPADELMKQAQKGMVEQFFNDELELRKILNYPPHTYFVHLTWQAEEATGKQLGEKIKQLLSEHDIQLYSDPHAKGSKRLFYGLLRVASGDWPSKTLTAKLRSLPPSIRITINPDRII